MSIDLDNLEMTYKKIYEVSVQIAQLIDRQIYTELVTFMSKKEQLFKEAGNLIEKVKAKNEDTSRLVEICTKIQKQEQENIVGTFNGSRRNKKRTWKNSKKLKAY